MSRCIDADALKIDFYDEYETEDDAYAYGYVSKHQIDMAPTIDAVEVVHGEWFPCAKNGLPLTELMIKEGQEWYGYKCSNCNAIYKGNALIESPYCQWCGAKMDGERKNND